MWRSKPAKSVNPAYLALGSNLGDRRRNLVGAIQHLYAQPGIEVISGSWVYETRPVGVVGQPDFLNLVLAIRTTLQPLDLLEACLKIEKEFGRERRERWGPRTLDIDVLLYGNAVLNNDRLTLPHPRMQERAFVLVPLAELSPEIKIGEATATDLAKIVDQSGLTRAIGWPEIFAETKAMQ